MRPSRLAGAAGAAIDRRETLRRYRRLKRSQSRERRAKYTRAFIACMVFVGLLGASWLIGTYALVGRPEAAAGAAMAQAKRTGRIVYELPGAVYCRYGAFDNNTGQIAEGAIVPCEPATKKRPLRSQNEFSWGQN